MGCRNGLEDAETFMLPGGRKMNDTGPSMNPHFLISRIDRIVP